MDNNLYRNISLNGTKTLTQADTIKAVVIEENLESPFAIALNGEFVAKSAYTNTLISDGDCIDIIKPVVGG